MWRICCASTSNHHLYLIHNNNIANNPSGNPRYIFQNFALRLQSIVRASEHISAVWDCCALHSSFRGFPVEKLHHRTRQRKQRWLQSPSLCQVNCCAKAKYKAEKSFRVSFFFSIFSFHFPAHYYFIISFAFQCQNARTKRADAEWASSKRRNFIFALFALCYRHVIFFVFFCNLIFPSIPFAKARWPLCAHLCWRFDAVAVTVRYSRHELSTERVLYIIYV